MDELIPLGDLKPDPQNRRKHGERNLAMLAASLQDVGASRSIVIDEAGEILAGNGVVQAATAAGLQRVQVVEADGETLIAVRRRGLSAEQKRALAIYDNRTAELAEWDWNQLAGDAAAGLTLEPWFTPEELNFPQAGGGDSRLLHERFGVPPFSVLDARQGYWQDRKRAWLALGIRSALGRTPTGVGTTTGKHSAMNTLSGRLAAGGDANDGTHVTSVFDPVLAELAVRWFCPPGGLVLDPFAGGSVRGIVAAKVGRRYLGIDLSAEQIAENRKQAAAICSGELVPEWVEGDARELAALAPEAIDFLFTSPPYGDLEIYSDDPRDLSTLDGATFLAVYRAIIAAGVARLRPDRFACVVVGDYRDEAGFYRGFVGATVQAFEDAGARFYNDAVLVTAIGSLPLRVATMFVPGRKLGKTHQNVLVFCKGDPEAATAAVGPVEFGEVEAEPDED